MKNNANNKISRKKLAIIITAITSVAVIILLAVMLVTHADPKLTKIEITSLPYKTEYIEKQRLDTSGLKVKAYYGDEAKEVTDYTVDKSVLEYGDDTVKVSYKGKTASFSVSVSHKSIVSIEVTKMPSKTVYFEGSLFEPSGVEIIARYDNGESFVISDWTHNGDKPLTVSDKSIVFAFGGKTTVIPITVEQKQLADLYLKRLPSKLKYTEGEYFDFLGLELYAKYENAPEERVYDWELDIKTPLGVNDNAITISYTLHGVTKSVTVNIEVEAAEQIADDQKLLTDLIELLPPTDNMTTKDLGALNYVLSVLDETELSESQRELKEELTVKRDELTAELPTEPEKEYSITYAVKDELDFADIDYGGNPTSVKEGQSFDLNAASSNIAVKQGYEFTGWEVDGKTVTNISNIESDKTIYAIFTLTPTVELVFKDKTTNAELWTVNPLRTENYNFDINNISSVILTKNGVLPVAYYLPDNERINSVDLNSGSSVTVLVLTMQIRELHLPDENLFTVGWRFEFTVDNANEETVAIAKTGSVFYIPIGAVVTVTATNANTDSIILDGENIGTKVNSSIVNAVFTMSAGEYPASITYTTKLTDMTTLSFVGQNVQSVVYPSGWNGIMSEIDLKNIAFAFDENSNIYLNVYNIDGSELYFEDLASYVFNEDTVINVIKKYNNFSLTVKYTNGKEVIDGITGKQTLSAALSAYSDEALALLNEILGTSNLFIDEACTVPLSRNELLSRIVRRDIIVYSDWKYIPKEPDIPTFEPVDYGEYSFVGTWSSLFSVDGEILSCELVLTADGNYSYKTYINGQISADACGVYRLDNNVFEIKTFVSTYKYDIFSENDLSVNISFCADGLLITNFVKLVETEKTTFEQVLFCGKVRPVNYSAQAIVGSYDINGINIVLSENGTATISIGDVIIEAYYRIENGNRIYLLENGSIGTGDITDFLEGIAHE